MTLSNLLRQVGAYVDQEATEPTGSDLTLRINYANRALGDWADAYDWNELTKKTALYASTASTTVISLPSNFKKPMSALYHYDATTPTKYEIIDKNDAYVTDPSKYVCYVDGNTVEGYSLVVPRGLSSGASLLMDIQVFPSSLATLTDVVPMSTPGFIVTQTIAYVLESRSDSRFPLVKSDAQRWLFNMLEAQHAKSLGQDNSIKMRSTAFRIGRGR